MNKCQSIFGHKFEARYSTQNTAFKTLIERATRLDSIPISAIEAMRDKKYVLDICVRCGLVIERTIHNEKAEP